MRWILAASLIALVSVPGFAALPTGAQAPLITASGAVAGKPYKFNLKRELRHGPVVLYFFPAANTKGCDLEAHLFSEAIAKFKAAGARVVGMSADDQKTLATFSTAKCAGAFPVATATPEIQKAYDVAWKDRPGLTTRTSYVIDRRGRIVLVHDDFDATQHAAKTLAAVQALKR